jgi:cytosol aminopeptidase
MTSAHLHPVNWASQQPGHPLNSAGVPRSSKPPKAGSTRIFYDTPPGSVTAFASLGEKYPEKTEDAKREAIRRAVGGGVKDIKALGDGIASIQVTTEEVADPHAAGT